MAENSKWASQHSRHHCINRLHQVCSNLLKSILLHHESFLGGERSSLAMLGTLPSSLGHKIQTIRTSGEQNHSPGTTNRNRLVCFSPYTSKSILSLFLYRGERADHPVWGQGDLQIRGAQSRVESSQDGTQGSSPSIHAHRRNSIPCRRQISW